MSREDYIPTIGIEIHCELKTKTKMFSSAPTSFGARANTNTSAVDLALPGTLPVVNKEAVRLAIKACAALECEIDPLVKFDRKNYYYSDLPKGFQITQQFHPIGKAGKIRIEDETGPKEIRIERIHMEEDTAKQFHRQSGTFLDFNRAGTPLIEIVSKPDIHSGEQAAAYVEALRKILYFLNVSDVKMEEGSMRCDVNISLSKDPDTLGVKTEIKNLNSISNVKKAVEAEIERQSALLDAGESVRQQTRRYDESLKKTVLMRNKEGAVDYKYFPEPNIFPIQLDPLWIEEIIENLEELPEKRKERLQKSYKLGDYDAGQLVSQPLMADFFEQALKKEPKANPKKVANWILTDMSAWMHKHNESFETLKTAPENLARLVLLIEKGVISGKQGKEVFEEVMLGKEPEQVIKEKGFEQISDQGSLEKLIGEVLADNPQSIADYKAGKDRAVKFLMGQVMKRSKGKANPKLANELLAKALKEV